MRKFAGPSGDDMTMMTAYGCPVFLRQAVEALARDACRGQQHTVAALLDRGLPFLRQIPGLLECLDARQMLLRVSCKQYTRQFLDHIVALDLPTAGLGDTQFCVRVDREQRGDIGVVAAAAGLPAHQSFTLALTAALIGSPYPPMREANNAMFGTLTEFHQRCRARALHCEALLSAEQPEAPTFRWTIDDVLDRQDK